MKRFTEWQETPVQVEIRITLLNLTSTSLLKKVNSDC